MQGVEVHLFVINEFPIEREYYGWLIFSEGEKYEKFKEKLIQEIENDERFQIYLELMNELEKEGKEKMAYEILTRILNEMPVEQQRAISYDILTRTFSDWPVEEQQLLSHRFAESC